VRGKLAFGRQRPSQEKEKVFGLRHPAPHQGIENIDRQDTIASVREAVTQRDQPAVPDIAGGL
jgi:hypothetical protein